MGCAGTEVVGYTESKVVGRSEAGEAHCHHPPRVSAELVETFSPLSNSSTPAPHGLCGGTCALGVSQLDNASGVRHVVG